jgi:hypothetical protein
VNCPRGGSRPRVWLRSPLFHPLTVLRGRRQGLPCTSAREPRTLSLVARPCPFRACEYELADTGLVLGRVLPGLVLVASGDSLRA